ncbi:Mysoin-binding motif of peroxisomes-domain-containing protein [Sporodiniella umbellata]|nr:Mysoin-binding motif of peroxisomes-domain-containing protein [Sporodiniella umbellata]
MSRMWRHSIFRDTFSVSLPQTEEAAFEEKLKYLIHRFSGQLPFQAARTTNFGVTANILSTLMVLFGVERYVLRRPIPLVTLTCSTSASFFFYYRYRRQSSIRQLYQSVLSKIQSFIEYCDTLDAKVHRVLITVQEIELVSRGYRLSTPLSPISRIEQSSRNKKCIPLRNKLASVLRRAFITHEEGIIDLINVVDKQHLLSLYGMYNVNSIASLSAVEVMDDEPYTLDQLKTLTQVMHLKRRECMVHFLALGADMDEKGWKIVNDVLDHLLNEIKTLTGEIENALDAEFYKPLNEFNGDTSDIEDPSLKTFIHRLGSLEQELRTLEANIYLCNECVQQLDPEESIENKEKILSDYLTAQKGFEKMLLEWENGKVALESYLELSPTTSPIKQEPRDSLHTLKDDEPQAESEGKGMFLDSEDVADILNLPSKASVYEAIAGVVERNGKERIKKSRNERIEEMKIKRAQEAEQRSKKMDSDTMVHELKDVLYKRNAELQ